MKNLPEGGNTKQDALQELASIAQANNMGYGPAEACSSFANSESGAMPRVYAEVDVEAERKLYMKSFPWMPLGWTTAQDREFDVWLAARTQADAGKAPTTTTPENT